MIIDVTEEEARKLAKSYRCDEPGCNGLLSVAWGGKWGFDRYVVRCGKDPEHKRIRPNIRIRQGYHLEKGWVDMANQGSSSLVKYDTPLGPVELSVEAIRLYLCPKATVEEAYIFLQKCRFQRLNPFMGEVYLVIYEQTQASPRGAQMIVGKEAYTRRAERHPDYLGMDAGLVISRAGEILEVAGAFMAPKDELLGGWCKVRRKGKEPFFISVTLKEYDKGISTWKRMPATMIRKVAVVQALREAFPSEMAGLQSGEEFGLTEDNPNIIEGRLAGMQPPKDLHFAGVTTEPKSTAAADVNQQKLEREIEELFPGESEPWTERAPADPDEVRDLTRTLDRDLDLLREPKDLFLACYEDFKLQPPQVLKITGYSRAADLAGQNLQQLYWQVNETQRKGSP